MRNSDNISMEEYVRRPEVKYAFLKGPRTGTTMGWNYIHSLHIMNLSRGFAPLARLMDMCWERGLPEDMRTYYRRVAADLGYRDYSLMRRYIQTVVNRAHKIAPAYMERVMGTAWRDGGEAEEPFLRNMQEVDFFVCSAAAEMLRLREEYDEMQKK